MWLGIVLPEKDTQTPSAKKKAQSSKKKDNAFVVTTKAVSPRRMKRSNSKLALKKLAKQFSDDYALRAVRREMFIENNQLRVVKAPLGAKHKAITLRS
jgi:hypothetical protein